MKAGRPDANLAAVQFPGQLVAVAAVQRSSDVIDIVVASFSKLPPAQDVVARKPLSGRIRRALLIAKAFVLPIAMALVAGLQDGPPPPPPCRSSFMLCASGPLSRTVRPSSLPVSARSINAHLPSHVRDKPCIGHTPSPLLLSLPLPPPSPRSLPPAFPPYLPLPPTPPVCSLLPPLSLSSPL